MLLVLVCAFPFLFCFADVSGFNAFSSCTVAIYDLRGWSPFFLLSSPFNSVFPAQVVAVAGAIVRFNCCLSFRWLFDGE